MLAVETKTENKTEVKELHTCCNCGFHGTDMVPFNVYIGGQGFVWVWECNDCLEHTEEESREAVQLFRAALWEMKKAEKGW